MAPSAKNPNMGQVIEYLPGETLLHAPLHSPNFVPCCCFHCFLTHQSHLDRLYLGSYLSQPDADTLFPYGAQAPKSPSKRSRALVSDTASSAAAPKLEPYYFTVDDSLLYNAFHHDFGPLHVGHLYRFALHFHEILAATESQQRPVVFWSRADPRSA